MIKELSTTQVKQDCAGTQADMTPCPNVNDIEINTLILGTGMTSGYYHDCGSGSGLRIWPKASGKSVVIVNPGSVTASTTAAEVMNVINVTLKHDGTNVTGTIAEVEAAINSTATVKDSIAALALGTSSTVCSVLASTPLAYLGNAYNKNLIRLPACPNCSSVELLSRTWDRIATSQYGTVTDKHRRVVNYLGKQLKTAGKIYPFAKAVVTAETSDPPDMPTSPPFAGTTPPFVVF